MVKNLLKVIHIPEALQQADHLRCLMCTSCNQQRSATDSIRTRSWSGDSKNYYVRDLTQDLFMKHVAANSFCGFCYQSRRNIMLQLLMTWFKPLPMNQISSRMSQPEMNHGSMAAIWKWRSSRPNGSLLVLHTWRGCSQVSARSRAC